MGVPWSADTPSGLLARTQLRVRWRSLVVLGLLAGITTGFAAAALAGGLRAGSALDRFEERTGAADAVVFPSQVGAFGADWDQLAAAPEVEEVAPWGLLFGEFGSDVPPEVQENGAPVFFPSIDGRYLGDVGRPIVLEGRMYDPDAPDEVVIDEGVPGFEVGDTFAFTPYAPDQIEESFNGGPAHGPTLDLRVVGRVRTVNQFLFTDGQVFPSPALVDTYRDQILLLENADVRLRHGADDIDALTRTLDELVAPGTPILDLHESARRVETTTAVERTALFLLAAAVAVAGLVLVGQALTQSAAASVDELPTHRALGMTRRDALRVALIAHLPTVVTAVVSALAVGIVASIWFPVGTAAEIDPDRGIQPTWVVLLPAAALVLLLTAGGVVLAAARAERARARAERPSRLLAGVRRVAPLPVGLGTTMALRSGRGRARVPVRQALVGAAVGILGVVGTMTLYAGLTDAVDHPERAGVAWDATAVPDFPDLLPRGVDPGFLAAAASAEGVEEAAVVDRIALPVDGTGVPTFTVRPLEGESAPEIGLVLSAGRAPEGDDEVALGPGTARDLDVTIGDTVAVGDDAVPMTVVGEALFPADVHAAFDEGAWLAEPGFDAVSPPVDVESGTGPGRLVAVRFADGVDPDDGLAALEAAVGDRASEVSSVEIPLELENLANVRTLPTVLAGFLALLAVAAVGHVLVTSARRRRQTFAVLRALGLSRRSSRWVLNSQGTTIGLIGLLVGIPVGVVIGRWGWSTVADDVPLVQVTPSAPLAVAVVVPAALLVANALAVWPGRRVARMRPADILRAE